MPSFPRNRPELQLPALAPDLIIASQGGQWRIERISEMLSLLSGAPPETLEGRPLSAAFSQTRPDLGELAREVASGGKPLDNVRVQLAGSNREATLVAAIHPGGLTDDYRGQRVLFAFRFPLPAEEQKAEAFHGIVGSSSATREVIRKILLYAASDASVVITGETGTGKELVARALHRESPRQGGPYVVMNCAAIAEELLESELFGHEKGAFTGALRTHRGRFERADGGSLFLDEIGDMPLHTQSKLLRVLEERRIERVGAEEEKEIDVRVLCATNVGLERAVGEGRFRADLYHRISVLRIHLPPLRERVEDIPALVSHFLDLFNRKYGRVIHRLTPEALQVLQAYLWPGNVRELRNVLERVYVETQAEVIGARAFGDWIRERQNFAPGGWDLDAGIDRRSSEPPLLAPFQPVRTARPLPLHGNPVFDAELIPPAAAGGNRPGHSTRPAELDREEIRQAYRSAGGNLAAAARLLGVHRATLYRYMKKLGISRDELAG